VVCTCNDIHAIPMEFYRPGRIDAIFATDLPDATEREEILEIHMLKRGKGEDLKKVETWDVSQACNEFTGAEIELVVCEAIFKAYNAGQIRVSTKLLVDSASRIVPQSRRNREELKVLRDWARERAIPAGKYPVKSDRNARILAKRS